MNILDEHVTQFFHFRSTNICNDFFPVVNSIKYFVNILVQRKVAEK